MAGGSSSDDAAPSSSSSKIDFTSLFFLGPQDRPGDYITPVRLKLDNFDAWKYAIRTPLMARRKFGFINGAIRSPTPPCTEEDWLTIHSMLVSWLLNTIDLEVKSTLPKYDNAHMLWTDLHERYSIVNGPRIQQLKSDIAKCKQSKNMHVSTYFGNLQVLWDELNKILNPFCLVLRWL